MIPVDTLRLRVQRQRIQGCCKRLYKSTSPLRLPPLLLLLLSCAHPRRCNQIPSQNRFRVYWNNYTMDAYNGSRMCFNIVQLPMGVSLHPYPSLSLSPLMSLSLSLSLSLSAKSISSQPHCAPRAAAVDTYI